MDIGLYLSAFILIFGAICWLVSVVCAWLELPRSTRTVPAAPIYQGVDYCDGKKTTATVRRLPDGSVEVMDITTEDCPEKLEPQRLEDHYSPEFLELLDNAVKSPPEYPEPDYLADCEWPVFHKDMSREEVKRIFSNNGYTEWDDLPQEKKDEIRNQLHKEKP